MVLNESEHAEHQLKDLEGHAYKNCVDAYFVYHTMDKMHTFLSFVNSMYSLYKLLEVKREKVIFQVLTKEVKFY